VPTPQHNETLAALYYAVRRHRGIVITTGEVGTGKTLLLRCLLRLLEDSEDIAYAYLFHNRLSAHDFLQYILLEYGLPAVGRSKSQLLFELGGFIASRNAKQMTTVLIIDEAHLLSDELLEEIRLLSNLETYSDKLLQIVMVGQPELDIKLDSVRLRPLKQRIALRTQLVPLTSTEAQQYIHQRLEIAGATQQDACKIFPSLSVTSIYRASRGYPRLINTICDNALITAYARQMTYVTSELVETVARELKLDVLQQFIAEGVGSDGHADTREDRDLEEVGKPVAGVRALETKLKPGSIKRFRQ
jgi:general secretion pathway protein A